MCSLIMYLYFWQFTQKCSEWISDSYCSLNPLWFGMGKIVLARTLPTLHPHTLPLCCNYLGYKYPRAMGGINTYVRRFAAGSCRYSCLSRRYSGVQCSVRWAEWRRYSYLSRRSSDVFRCYSCVSIYRSLQRKRNFVTVWHRLKKIFRRRQTESLHGSVGHRH